MTALAPPAMAVPLSAVDDLRVDEHGALTAEKTITTANPYLSGHYPGRPIYPGVFVLESVVQAARRLLGNPELVLAEVESVRLRAPLLPGDTLRLDLSFTEVLDGYRVRARGTRSDGAAAASLTLRCVELGRRARSADDAVPVAGPSGTVPVDVRDLLPHRPPILLVDRVVEHVPGERAVTEFTVRTSQPCYRHLPSEVARQAHAYPDSLVLESFTQSCGMLFLLARATRAPGTLAFGNARAVRLSEPVFPGRTMRHEVWLERVLGDTALLHGRTTVDGRVCLTVGSLAVLSRDGLTGAGS